MQLHLRAIARLTSVVPILAMEYLTMVEPSDYDGEHAGSNYAVTTDGEERILTIIRDGTESILRVSVMGENLHLAFEGPTHPELGALCEALGLKSSTNGTFDPVDHETLLTRLTAFDSCRLLMVRLSRHTDDLNVVVSSAIRLLTFGNGWHNNRVLALGTDERRAKRAETEASTFEDNACNFASWEVPGLKSIRMEYDPRFCCLGVTIDGYHEMTIPVIHFEWPLGSLSSHLTPVTVHGSGKYAVKPTTIGPKVLGVLGAALVDGNAIRLTRQLDSKTYKDVNALLNELGGTWHTGKQAHVFDSDPSGVLRDVLSSGVIYTAKDFEYFPTCPAEVARVVKLADLQPGHRVLEPSAGQGAIAMACAEIVGRENVIVHELMPKNAAHLQTLGFAISGSQDFLSLPATENVDRICMNPPFSGGRDVVHVMHAMKFLKPGGVLVSIMSTSWRHTNNVRSAHFRAFLNSTWHSVQDIKAGAFRDSGTDVATTLVRIVKPLVARTPSGSQRHQTVAPEQVDLFA